jgi:hypothetical protein
MTNEEVITYCVPGDKINKQVRYVPGRDMILVANYHHFSTEFANFQHLIKTDEGFKEEKKRAETAYNTIKTNPKQDQIEEIVLDDKNLLDIRITKYESENIDKILLAITNYETSKELMNYFFF